MYTVLISKCIQHIETVNRKTWYIAHHHNDPLTCFEEYLQDYTALVRSAPVKTASR